MLIYKIFRAQEWDALATQGETLGAPIDLADGFIHFSTADQAQTTADLHFSGVQGLVVAAVDTAPLGDTLKWEMSRGGAEFPHLFAALKRDQVVWVKDLPLVDGRHQFPAEMK
ncbi:MAG: DUF952 domain-containing protein [Pseudomonadota bacterium]